MQAAGPLERSGELETLESLVAGAVDGTGGVVVVEGPPGIGKSRLLREAAESAEFLGARTLRARATELERLYPFGVALQLFEPPVAAAGDEDRATLLAGAAALAAPLVAPGTDGLPDAPNDFSLIHGLHWLAANLAETRPTLLIVDDAHWADEPSLRLCAYLAERIEDLPIALVLAARPGGREHGTPGDVIVASLAAHPATRTLRPAPLSEDAVGRLIEGTLDVPAAPEFVSACARVTGGNPYLLSELLAATAAGELDPTAAGVAQLDGLTPRGVLRTVAARLAALPPGDADLARAVSVLDGEATLHHAAQLAGLDLDEAGRAADRLATADLLRPGEPLTFSHPLTASAVAAELPEGARGAGHLRAAELLRDEGAPPERLAAHLLEAPAGGRAWVVEALRAAARRSLALGAPAVAVEQLRRALAEPPEAELRRELLVELGRAEATAGSPTAGDRLVAAAKIVAEPAERAQTLRELARTRVSTGDHAGAREAYAEAVAALDPAVDAELAAHLRAERLVVAALDSAERPDTATIESILGDARMGTTPVSRALLATLALHELYAGASRDRTLALAERALGGGALLDDEGAQTTVYGVVGVLFTGERLVQAEALLDTLVARAKAGGAVMDLAGAAYSRAWTRLIAGRVRDAVDDAQQAVDAGRHGWRQFLAGAYGALAHALLDAGDDAEAERHVLDSEALHDPGDVMSIQILDARGRLHALRGRHERAAEDFLAAGELAAGQTNPLLYATWRSNAGLALARTGATGRARELIAEELELARAFGAPRGIAVALRALGVVEGGARGLELLSESVRVLEGSEARLERMRSLAEYGAALRRAGRRTDAAQMLGDALALARPAGAGAVERRAADELAVAGARAVRRARRGPAALSPSERRVTMLAASGMTNREIAEELFVTRKAVEWHLSNAYTKLGIASRKDLPAALEGGDDAAV